MRSISWKLAIAFILIVFASIGVTSFLISQTTAREFQQYVSFCNNAYVNSVADDLIAFYNTNNSWNNVEGPLKAEIKTSGQRLILADNNGTVLSDTGGQWQGKATTEIGLSQPIILSSSAKQVGQLYAICNTGNGMCQMGQPGAGKVSLSVEEQNFLNSVNNYLWIAGVIAAALAIVFGLILTRQITLPIGTLKRGAQQLAAGNLSYRVKVSSKDELGQLADSFNSMATSLDKMEQSRKHLTADITHELRTPLTVIEGTVDGMLDGVFKPDKEHLEWIREQTTLLTRLINDLRDLSLAESGQLKLNIATVNIVELLEHKLSQVRKKAQDKGILLELNSTEPVIEVEADSARVEQVVSNLVNNAIRHTDSGGKISLSLKTPDKLPEHSIINAGVIISVSDTGEGIPAEHLPNVFNRFYRVEDSRSKQEGETGLGLAIVKQMVEAHGGKVWVESELNKGSTFSVFLPFKR